MTATGQTVAEARRRADVARAEFQNALTAARERISPDRLKRDAVVAVTNRMDDTRAAGVALVRRRPILSVLIGGTLAVLIFWRPARALTRGTSKLGRFLREQIEQWRMRHGNAEQDEPTGPENDEWTDQDSQERDQADT